MRKIFDLLILACLASLLLTSCGDTDSIGDGSTISADKIIKRIKQGKTVCISDKTITGKLDFTKSASSNKKLAVSAVYIAEEVCFRNCIFEDTVTTFSTDAKTKASVLTVFDRNVVFDGCDFKSALVMQQADFRGRLDLDNSKVRGESDFTGTHFRNGCSFMSANFDGNVYFVSCNFDGKSKFFKVLFKNSAIFQHLSFHDAATFADAYFYGGVELDDIATMSVLDFAKAKFSGNVHITNSRFYGNMKLASCKFNKFLGINGNTFAGSLDMRSSQLGKRLEATGNYLLAAPVSDGLTGLDSCEVFMDDNKIITTNIKQIF